MIYIFLQVHQRAYQLQQLPADVHKSQLKSSRSSFQLLGSGGRSMKSQPVDLRLEKDKILKKKKKPQAMSITLNCAHNRDVSSSNYSV